MTEPTPADLAAQIASLPAAERAIVQALIDRFLLLAGPRPKRRRPPALPPVPPEVEARVLRELADHGLAPSR